jgi:excisionase family DNA binding protein
MENPSTLSLPADCGDRLLSVREVAAVCGFSPRTVYRLADRGALPRPRKCGALVRWSRREISDWIAGGCKPIRVVTSQGLR